MTACKGCGTPTDDLDLFPGRLCLACFAATDEGQRMPTADEIVATWKGLA